MGNAIFVLTINQKRERGREPEQSKEFFILMKDSSSLAKLGIIIIKFFTKLLFALFSAAAAAAFK